MAEYNTDYEILFLSAFLLWKIIPELKSLKQNLAINIFILCPCFSKKSVFWEREKSFMQQSLFTQTFAKYSSLSSIFLFFIGLILSAF